MFGLPKTLKIVERSPQQAATFTKTNQGYSGKRSLIKNKTENNLNVPYNENQDQMKKFESTLFGAKGQSQSGNNDTQQTFINLQAVKPRIIYKNLKGIIRDDDSHIQKVNANRIMDNNYLSQTARYRNPFQFAAEDIVKQQINLPWYTERQQSTQNDFQNYETQDKLYQDHNNPENSDLNSQALDKLVQQTKREEERQKKIEKAKRLQKKRVVYEDRNCAAYTNAQVKIDKQEARLQDYQRLKEKKQELMSIMCRINNNINNHRDKKVRTELLQQREIINNLNQILRNEESCKSKIQSMQSQGLAILDRISLSEMRTISAKSIKGTLDGQNIDNFRFNKDEFKSILNIIDSL